MVFLRDSDYVFVVLAHMSSIAGDIAVGRCCGIFVSGFRASVDQDELTPE